MKADPLSQIIAFLRVLLKDLSPAPSHMGSYWLTAKLTHLGRAPGCHPGAPPNLRTSRSPGWGALSPLSRLHAPLCGRWAARVPSAGRHHPPILPRGRGASTQLRAGRALYSGA